MLTSRGFHAALFAPLALLTLSSPAPAQRLSRSPLPTAPAARTPVPAPAPSRDAYLQRLALPADPGASFEVELVLAGARDRLQLVQHSLRAPNSKVRVFVRDDLGRRYVDTVPPPVRTYRGALASDPTSVVLASFTDRGFEAEIETPYGPGWRIRATADGYHEVVLRAHDHDDFDDLRAPCGVVDGATPPVSIGSSARVTGQPNPSIVCTLQLAEIAFDADFEYYQLHGSSVSNVIAQIDAHMNLVDYFYARDVLITYDITGYVVRTAPFYTPTSGGDLLDQFRDEWNANQGGIQRDIGHLMTAKPGAVIQYGGLAWVGVVCGNYAYGWSLDSANIIGHEVGHNWAAPHCLDPSPCNAMCGACLNIGPITKGVIEAHRDSRVCLDTVGPYSTPLPPYAHPESQTVTKANFGSIAPLTFDVLRNDHDGNCGQLFLLDFDAESERGGTIKRSVDTGRKHRSELIYTFPSEPWVGADRFEYTVVDLSDGMTSKGTVTVDVRSPGLEAYWTFDDQIGTTIADSSGNGYDAIAQQPVEWIFPSKANGAMRFNGVDQLLDTNTTDFAPPWSVSAWIGRKMTPGPTSALADSSDGSLRTEQWFDSNKVGVTKYGEVDATFNHVLPLHTWRHVVWVGTKNATSLFVDGVFIQKLLVSIRAPMAPASSAGDPLAAVVDDLRVHNYALTRAQIDDLYQHGGGAVAPGPRDGGHLGVDTTPLAWVPGLMADSHDVYFGEDWEAVRSAVPFSPEHAGNVVGNSISPGVIVGGRTYYWRVDTNVGAEVLPGPLWQFELSDRWRWRLDETSGTVATQDTGGLNAVYLGGVLLNQTGATLNTGTSVRLDGFDDSVRIPAMNLNSNEVTFMTWVKRDGAQSDFRGLVFSRGGSTTAGMNLSTSYQLGYHWNGQSATWSWSSGLTVPDGVWVFTALVITPAKATMYLGQGGVLTSASNSVTHDIEEFDDFTYIGRDTTGSRYFKGWMDDVRIYDAALSTGEVDALYQASL